MLVICLVLNYQAVQAVELKCVLPEQPAVQLQSKADNKLLDAVLRFYQRYISQQIGADCLYHQSCSRYTRQQLKQRGIKGFFTGLDQFVHCSNGMEREYPEYYRRNGKVHRE